MKNIKIAVLNADHLDEFVRKTHGSYPDMFENLFRKLDPSIRTESFDVIDGIYPDPNKPFDAYLVTGSKFSVYDELPWIRQLERFVQSLHRQQQTLIGICFGHQLIAKALGGRTEKASQGWGIGCHTIRIFKQAQWMDSPEKAHQLRLLVSHQDQVVEKPSGAQCLGGSDFCPYGIIQIGETALSFQGHPEFTKEYLRYLLGSRRKLFSENLYSRALESLALEADSERAGDWIIQFIKGNVSRFPAGFDTERQDVEPK